MIFEGQYLTYTEYQGLGGSAIGEMPFNVFFFEARKRIDTKTFNRLKNVSSLPQEVKMCVYNLINSIMSYVNDGSINKNIASENTDGYSVSYVSAGQLSELLKSKNEELDDIINTYLFGIVVNNEHLIYAGV